jgi:hypothetical protein
MMTDDRKVYRPTNLASETVSVRDQLRLALETAAKVLSEPGPDTFLGRKTQDDPFPQEETRSSGTASLWQGDAG